MTPEIPTETFEIYAKGLDHPECCAFDQQQNLWAGGEAGQIYRIDQNRQVEEVARLGGFCAGIAFSPDQILHVCDPSLGIVRVEPSGEHTVFADACAGRRIREANFLVFDRAGHRFATDSGEWKGTVGRLMRFETDGTGMDVATGFVGWLWQETKSQSSWWRAIQIRFTALNCWTGEPARAQWRFMRKTWAIFLMARVWKPAAICL